MGDLLGKVKLLFQKDKHLHNDLYKILGFFPRNIELYKIALSHSSNTYSKKDGRSYNNERLEFLGDAILSAVVSDILYRHFENKREGFLTNTRSKIVQRSTLNELSSEMGVEKLIRSKAKKTSHNSYISGNAFEALIGAIYLDRGYNACKSFVEKQILKKFVNVDVVAKTEVNFKSKLLEYCQKNRFTCEFTLKNVDNNDNNAPVFRSIVQIEEVMSGEGKGYSKKESEQEASKDALMRLSRNDKLKNQIFDSKEKRTAMEASEYAAVPRISEIEEALHNEAEERAERKNQKAKNNNQKAEDIKDAKAKNMSKPDNHNDVKDQKKAESQKPSNEKPLETLQKSEKEQTPKPDVKPILSDIPQKEKIAEKPEDAPISTHKEALQPVKEQTTEMSEETVSEKKEKTPAKKSVRKTGRRTNKKETPQPEPTPTKEGVLKQEETTENKPQETQEAAEKKTKKQDKPTAKRTTTKKTTTKKATKKTNTAKEDSSKAETATTETEKVINTDINEKVIEEKPKKTTRKLTTSKKTEDKSKAVETEKVEISEIAPEEQKEEKSAEKKSKTTRKSSATKKATEKKPTTKKATTKKTTTKKSVSKKSTAEQSAEETK